MQWVRDPAIVELDKMIDGRLKGITAKHVQQMLEVYDVQQREVLHRLVPEFVDIVLHHLLWMLQQQEAVTVAVQVDAGTVPDIDAISDGLTGNLPRWIAQLSEQRRGLYER